MKLKDILLGEIMNTHGSEPLDGKSKTSAANWVHGKIKKHTSGFFTDEYWKPIQSMFKDFDKLGLKWVSTGARYEEARIRTNHGDTFVVPVRKVWTFEISFINNRDKGDILHGRIVADGAGPADSPLDKYDVTVTVN